MLNEVALLAVQFRVVLVPAPIGLAADVKLAMLGAPTTVTDAWAVALFPAVLVAVSV
jgi:hypothetical protein